MSNADTTALRPLVVTETITYRSITLGLPDAGITVLAWLTNEASEPTAMAYLDDSGWIECATGENITHLVTHWAEQPGGAARTTDRQGTRHA